MRQKSHRERECRRLYGISIGGGPLLKRSRTTQRQGFRLILLMNRFFLFYFSLILFSSKTKRGERENVVVVVDRRKSPTAGARQHRWH